MDAVQRRAALSDYLSQAAGPVSASVLAARFSVSRQIIVGGHRPAEGRRAGHRRHPRGYLLPRPTPRSDPPAGLCPPAGGHGPGAGAHGG